MLDTYRTLILPDVQQMLLEDDNEGLKAFCGVVHSVVVAEILEELTDDQIWKVLYNADISLRVEIFEHLTLKRQELLAEQIELPQLADLLAHMSSDDRVDLMSRLSADRCEGAMRLLASTERNEIRKLLSYDESSAGSIMTTEYASLPAKITVREAIDLLRQQAPNSETIYYVYIIDQHRHLEGFISLRELILARPDAILSDIMERDVVRMKVTDEREAVAQRLARYNFLAVPIVDDENHLVGIVTHDDALDVVQEEATEDAYLQGAVQPLEDSYEETPMLTILWKRGIWLVFLSVMALTNAKVLDYYSTSYDRLTTLVLMFLPLVMGSGGNAGSQSATLFIRMIALQGSGMSGRSLIVENRAVILREFFVALSLGTALATLDFIVAKIWFHRSTEESIVIAGTVITVVVLGTSFGALLPLILRRLGMDPAIMSNPLIASILDVLAVSTFFQIAVLLL